MKKKLPVTIKDGLTGAAMGASALVPGVSGGTIAYITGCFQKIINALSTLISKKFFKSLLILIPFLVGAVISIFALIIPLKFALQYCLFAVVCLFAGLVIGSLPGVFDDLKGNRIKPIYFVGAGVAFFIAASIGVLSVIFKFNAGIDALFTERSWYYYFILILVGIVGAFAFIMPGFSGSMLLMVIGFYEHVLNLFNFSNFFKNIPSLLCLALGAATGIIVCSKILNILFEKHKTVTIITIIGFIIGSLISLFVSSGMFSYFNSGFNTIDIVLAPILLVGGTFLSYLLVKISRKRKSENA